MGSACTARSHYGAEDEQSDHESDIGPVFLSNEFDFVPLDNRIADFGAEFEEVKVLGSGSTCSVWSMRQKETGKQCAVKKMERSSASNTRGFKREANILSKITHNHVVALVGLYVDHTNYYVVQELCTGGVLLDRVKREPLSEREAIQISYQILDGVKFLHDHNIVHRDIKPENIMYQSARSERIVLVDFGQAREIREADEFKDWVGTPMYMAPEVTRPRTGADLKKTDVWAVGVTVYILLNGRYPFFGNNVKQLLREICQKRLAFPKGKTPYMARKFISSLLTRNLENRPTAEQAMQHEWLQSDIYRSSNHILKAWTDNVSSYENSTKLKQLAVNIALERMDEITKTFLDAAFNMIDMDNDGSIQEDDYTEFFRSRGMSADRAEIRGKSQLEAISCTMVADQQAFNKASVATEVGANEEKMQDLFELIDIDGDGKITAKEIQMVSKDWLCMSLDEEEAETMIAEVDGSGDGFITIREFKDAMRRLTFRRKPMV